MRRLIPLVFVAVAGCGTVPGEHARLMRLPIDEFNAPSTSWRALEGRRDFLGAATLLEAYLAKNAPALPEYERVLAWFHAAQMRAFADDSKTAVPHLRHARFKAEPADWPVPWNHYVAATEAFLRRDRAALQEQRRHIRDDPRWQGRVPPSLNVVDSLIEHFDLPYLEAYRRTQPPPPGMQPR